MVPPVPIPNTAVKRRRADGSACIACARVGHCRGYLAKARAEKSARAFHFRGSRASALKCGSGIPAAIFLL